MSKLISVIIPCFGMGAHLQTALDGVRNQKHSEWEVIIIDDAGPEDGTTQIAADFVQSIGGSRSKFIRHETNRGVSSARNTGVSLSRGEFIAFLDPDDSWSPDHLSRHLAGHRDIQQPAVISSQAELVNSDGGVLGQLGPDDFLQDFFPRSLLLECSLVLSATTIARKAFEQLGGFDEAPAIQHVEDWDLWIRAAEAGFPFRSLDHVTVSYLKHSGAATAQSERMRLRRVALVEKHGAKMLEATMYFQRMLMHDLWRPQSLVQRSVNGPLLRLARKLEEALF